MSAFAGIMRQCHGVEVPGREGRAGMAAIVCEEGLSLAICGHIWRRPARLCTPLFLRIRGEIDATATFKQRKIALVKDGFDRQTSVTRSFSMTRAVAPMCAWDGTLYGEIVSGEVRL